MVREKDSEVRREGRGEKREEIGGKRGPTGEQLSELDGQLLHGESEL